MPFTPDNQLAANRLVHDLARLQLGMPMMQAVANLDRLILEARVAFYGDEGRSPAPVTGAIGTGGREPPEAA